MERQYVQHEQKVDRSSLNWSPFGVYCVIDILAYTPRIFGQILTLKVWQLTRPT